MSLLFGTNYDPATAVLKSCGTAAALTALDTTNLRATFTAPASGRVLVRMAGTLAGSGTHPGILFGVLEAAVVKGRVSARGTVVTSPYQSVASWTPIEAVFTVSGLSPGSAYVWDAAWSVKSTSSSHNLAYGGPNDTSTGGYGAFQFEVWAA